MTRLGKYELLRRLSAGGMAELYLARQSGPEGFEKKVVVKRLHAALAGRLEVVQMFCNEARIAARLTHPNIAQIYDLGTTGGQYFIAMEHVHGRDLHEVQERSAAVGRHPPYSLVAHLLRNVCAGLHYAHTLTDALGRSLGIVHRDVSPQNVILSFRGEVKLVDFGIAKATSVAAETQAGLLRGKYAYMSPEQCRGETIDARSDLFSAGILLYELACRRRLFRRNNELATIRAIIEDPIPPPSAVIDDVPDELEAIIMRALARVPEDRYPDAREMQLELEEAMRENAWSDGEQAAAEYLAALFPEGNQGEPLAAGAAVAGDAGLLVPSLIEIPTVLDSLVAGDRKLASRPIDVRERALGQIEAFEEAEPTIVQLSTCKEPAGARSGALAPVLDADEELTIVPPYRAAPAAASSSLARPPPVPAHLSSGAGLPAAPGETPRSSPDGSSAAMAPPPPAARHLPPVTGDGAVEGARPAPGLQAHLGTTVVPSVTNRRRAMIAGGILGTVGVALAILVWAVVDRDQARREPVVVLISDPPGATVYVDGQKRFGQTPLALYGLDAAREVTISLLREGYQPWSTRLSSGAIAAGKPLSVKLVRSGPGGEPATLEVTTTPAGAAAYLDGVLQGRTPLTLERVTAGAAHRLVFQLPGFEPASLEVQPLQPRERRAVTLTLHPPRPAPKGKERGEPPRHKRAPVPGTEIAVPRGTRHPGRREGQLGERLPR